MCSCLSSCTFSLCSSRESCQVSTTQHTPLTRHLLCRSRTISLSYHTLMLITHSHSPPGTSCSCAGCARCHCPCSCPSHPPFFHHTLVRTLIHMLARSHSLTRTQARGAAARAVCAAVVHAPARHTPRHPPQHNTFLPRQAPPPSYVSSRCPIRLARASRQHDGDGHGQCRHVGGPFTLTGRISCIACTSRGRLSGVTCGAWEACGACVLGGGDGGHDGEFSFRLTYMLKVMMVNLSASC